MKSPGRCRVRPRLSFATSRASLIRAPCVSPARVKRPCGGGERAARYSANATRTARGPCRSRALPMNTTAGETSDGLVILAHHPKVSSATNPLHSISSVRQRKGKSARRFIPPAKSMDRIAAKFLISIKNHQAAELARRWAPACRNKKTPAALSPVGCAGVVAKEQRLVKIRIG